MCNRNFSLCQLHGRHFYNTPFCTVSWLAPRALKLNYSRFLRLNSVDVIDERFRFINYADGLICLKDWKNKKTLKNVHYRSVWNSVTFCILYYRITVNCIMFFLPFCIIRSCKKQRSKLSPLWNRAFAMTRCLLRTSLQAPWGSMQIPKGRQKTTKDVKINKIYRYKSTIYTYVVSVNPPPAELTIHHGESGPTQCWRAGRPKINYRYFYNTPFCTVFMTSVCRGPHDKR